LLERSDILLLPSNNEGLALVCYEAVAHGCIPISTRVGSQDEVLPDGLLVPLAPRAAVSGTVAAVDAMWRDAGTLARHKDALQAAWTRLTADPTAEEVLMPVYRRLSQGDTA
jgi:glycosyltransferase involved in cell wall biosynthesis